MRYSTSLRLKRLQNCWSSNLKVTNKHFYPKSYIFHTFTYGKRGHRADRVWSPEGCGFEGIQFCSPLYNKKFTVPFWKPPIIPNLDLEGRGHGKTFGCFCVPSMSKTVAVGAIILNVPLFLETAAYTKTKKCPTTFPIYLIKWPFSGCWKISWKMMQSWSFFSKNLKNWYI